ncbi:MAG: DNA-binding GntR family transcriptional regulator [Gammaproteobacteria bacterium]|jgi:DNA-binding GntR family transcriptional regulator
MDKSFIYNDLKKRILTLQLEPGSALDEKTLAGVYKISRTPMREILRNLSGDGYVNIIDNRGAYVSSMSHKVLRNFFQTAAMLYSAVGRLAAENATPKQLVEIREAQHLFRQAIESNCAQDRVYWNQRFHSIMGEMADNPYLKPSYDRLLIDHARISQTFYRPGNDELEARLQSALLQHDEMIAAIENRDGESIVNSIVEHWELSRDLLEYFVKPDPLSFDMAVMKSL